MTMISNIVYRKNNPLLVQESNGCIPDFHIPKPTPLISPFANRLTLPEKGRQSSLIVNAKNSIQRKFYTKEYIVAISK